MNVIRKLVYWFIFSVIICLLPIIFKGIVILSESGITKDIFERLFSRGDILIVAVCISATAIGELLLSKGQDSRWIEFFKTLVGGCCVLMLILASCYFAYVAYVYREGAVSIQADPVTVSWISIGIFAFSVVTSGGCLILTEVGQ